VAGSTNSLFVSEVQKFLGDAYVYGAAGPITFDCSGLVQYALAQIGISAPRTSEEQWAWVQKISQSQLQAGDLVFLNFPGEVSPGHVEIYTGNGNMIGADNPSVGVRIDSLAGLQSNVVGYGRVPGVAYSGATGGGVAPGAAGSTGTGAAPSGVSSIVSDIITGLSLPATWLSDLANEPSDVASALLGVAAPFAKIAESIDWLFHPNHWIRIFAGLGGGLLVLGGSFQLFHTGGEIPVSAYGVSTSIGIPRAASLPMGILFVGIGGILLFVAFHNLPSTVTTFPGFLAFLAQEISPKTPAAA
jgi:NlpC/P60 family